MGTGSEWDKTNLSEADKELLENVERYGWSFMYVAPRADDPVKEPVWGYTIGVYRTWSHPELVVFGPPHEHAHGILANVVDRIARGERLEVGREYRGILEDYGCRFLTVDPKWYGAFLGFAQWFYESPRDFPVIQLVLPDKEGRYPWEAAYSIPKGTQPLLLSDEDASALGFSST